MMEAVAMLEQLLNYGSQGAMVLMAIYMTADRVRWGSLMKRMERMSDRLRHVERLLMHRHP